MLSVSQAELSAQQAPAWPQNDPNNGQFAPDASPYAQQPYGQPGYPEQPGPANVAQQPLTPEELNQLVAPIALYPDALVAQVLAASTYPQQVAAAYRWRQTQAYSSSDQIVAGADVQNWDPSVKSLTAFPQVLAQMDANLQWTTDLGNAYYNQPQDVLEAVQVMRQRAQAAGNLGSTPQETVTYDQGNIELAPPTPQVVYVPIYNPWAVYGQPVTPYPGFSLLGAIGSFVGSAFSSTFGSGFGSSPIRFGLGIAMAAFSHTPWGLLSWGLSWLTHSILFNNSDYFSNSTTVADWGFPRGGPRAFSERHAFAGRPYSYSRTPGGRVPGYGRSGFDSNQRFGSNRNFESSRSFESNQSRQALTSRPDPSFRSFDRQSEARPSQGFAGTRPPDLMNHGYETREGNYQRPTQQAYNHVPAPAGRTEQYSRPSYGNGFVSDRGSAYARPGTAYSRPAAGYEFGAYRDQSSAKQSHPGGFHLFGSKHSSENFNAGGRAPQSFKSARGFKSEKRFKPEKSFKRVKSFGGGKSFKPGKSSGGGKSGGHFHGGGHSGGIHLGGLHH